MRIDLDTFTEIINTITSNRMRSFLTAFGVFWGIFMLLVLLGGGGGLKMLMSSNFEGFAQNSAFLFPQETSMAYKGFRKGRRWHLDKRDIEQIRQLTGVEAVTNTNSNWGQTAVYGDKKSNVIMKGVYPDYARIEEPHLKAGRYINAFDNHEGRKVCAIGKRVCDDLFGNPEEAIGKYIKAGSIYYKVVGVVEGLSEMNINGSADESVQIPFSTFAVAYNTGDDVGLVCLTAKEGYKMTELQPDIERLVKRNHHIHPDDKQAVMMLNAEAMFSMVDSLFKGINMLVWMIGLGTLLSGIIGVSNIMMVTVKERTSEIGIRRAIGATPKVIMSQILAESMVLTLVAGMTGITLSVGLLELIDKVMAMNQVDVHFQVGFLLAIGTSLLVAVLGVVAGIAPAYRAMAIKPIDAIRDE